METPKKTMQTSEEYYHLKETKQTMKEETFSQKTKDDIQEILMNLNRGRLAVTQSLEQILSILQPIEQSEEDLITLSMRRSNEQCNCAKTNYCFVENGQIFCAYCKGLYNISNLSMTNTVHSAHKQSKAVEITDEEIDKYISQEYKVEDFDEEWEYGQRFGFKRGEMGYQQNEVKGHYHNKGSE